MKQEQDKLANAFINGFKAGFQKAKAEHTRAIEKILHEEIVLAHTTASGKTSRLTSAYNRIMVLLQMK